MKGVDNMKHTYLITVHAADVGEIRGKITTYIDAFTAKTDAIPENIIKAMTNIYNDEHPDREITLIKVERI